MWHLWFYIPSNLGHKLGTGNNRNIRLVKKESRFFLNFFLAPAKQAICKPIAHNIVSEFRLKL